MLLKVAVTIHRWLARLPGSWLRALGHGAGLVIMRGQGKRRKIADANIRLCLPDLSPKEHQKLLTDHAKALGLGLLESSVAWYASDQKIDRIMRINGADLIDQALKKKRGVLLVCGHFTTLELSVRSLGRITRFTGVWRPLGIPALDKATRQGRLKAAEQLIEKSAFRAALKCLRRGGVVAMAIDQADSTSSAINANFFGHPASSIDTPARLAKQLGCVVLPFFTHRDGTGYVTEIGPELSDIGQLSAVEAAEKINAIIETQVHQSPAEYYWVHRKFKHTLPEIYAD